MLIEPHDDSDVTPEQIATWLEPRIVKWWMPDRILIASVPLTATGKIDKKSIRDKYAGLLSEADQH